MLSDVMEHLGLSKSFRHLDAFETEHHRQLLKDLKIAIHEGGLMALTGMLGSGKTVLLGRLQDQLRQEGQIEVAESLTFAVPRVTLDTLKSDILAPDALELFAERLSTPLQSHHYLTRILEQAHRFGEKPVTPTIVNATLAPDMHALEPTLTRYGYNVKALSELLHIRQAEVHSFLHGQLPPGRTEDLHRQLLAAGIPLGDHLSLGSRELATG